MENLKVYLKLYPLNIEIGELTHRWPTQEKCEFWVAGQMFIKQRACTRRFPEPYTLNPET